MQGGTEVPSSWKQTETWPAPCVPTFARMEATPRVTPPGTVTQRRNIFIHIVLKTEKIPSTRKSVPRPRFEEGGGVKAEGLTKETSNAFRFP